MKKNIYLILYLIIPSLLAGCQTESEYADDGYIQVTATIVYPEGMNTNSYKITCNGKDLSKAFFPATEKEVKFQAFLKESESLELDTIIALHAGENEIELIKLPGEKLKVYNAESYITFSASLAIWERYRVVLNGQDIVEGTNYNYIKEKKAKSTLFLYKKGENDPVYSMDVDLKNGDKLTILQLSEDRFDLLSDEGEEKDPPQTENLSKIRFFYSPIDKLNVPAIEVELFSYDHGINVIENITPSLIVEKGKLSSYIELDIAKYKDTYDTPAEFAYSIYAYDTETKTRGELIEDVMNGGNMFTLETQADDKYKMKYKFSTYQITNSSGFRPKFIMGTEW